MLCSFQVQDKSPVNNLEEESVIVLGPDGHVDEYDSAGELEQQIPYYHDRLTPLEEFLAREELLNACNLKDPDSNSCYVIRAELNSELAMMDKRRQPPTMEPHAFTPIMHSQEKRQKKDQTQSDSTECKRLSHGERNEMQGSDSTTPRVLGACDLIYYDAHIRGQPSAQPSSPDNRPIKNEVFCRHESGESNGTDKATKNYANGTKHSSDNSVADDKRTKLGCGTSEDSSEVISTEFRHRAPNQIWKGVEDESSSSSTVVVDHTLLDQGAQTSSFTSFDPNSSISRNMETISSDKAGVQADAELLEKVVSQLQSDDPAAAKAAAADVEYLVSSSDPKGVLSVGTWVWTSEGAKLNRKALGSFSNLWESLLGLLQDGDSETKACVCGAMSKLGFRNTTNVLAMIKFPGMLTALTQLLDVNAHPHNVPIQAWRVLQNCVSGIDEVKVILCSNNDVVWRMKEACARDGIPDEIRMRAVSVIMHASSSESAKMHLVKTRIPEEALQAVLSSQCNMKKGDATRIRATLASANLCGREERSILSTAPEMLREIVNVISHAMQGTEYFSIKWSLVGVMLPLFNLSCSDSNKKVLIECGTIELLLRGVNQGRAAYTTSVSHDDSEWSNETLELTLRTLANFTFDADARNQMIEQNALSVLQDVLMHLRSQHAKGKILVILQDLVFMLSEKNDKMIEQPSAQPLTVHPGKKNDQHIMISYSWSVGKAFVVEVARALRQQGHDVWRDEDGSKLVQKMMGSSMEIMAKAIELAEFVIIFVSRSYRDSYNCKLEGKYAQVRERAGLTRILFVMMEDDYTPQSPDGVDGWLGMLIGDSFWYQGWDFTKLDETVFEICKAIEKTRHSPVHMSRNGENGSGWIQPASSSDLGTIGGDSTSVVRGWSGEDTMRDSRRRSGSSPAMSFRSARTQSNNGMLPLSPTNLGLSYAQAWKSSHSLLGNFGSSPSNSIGDIIPERGNVKEKNLNIPMENGDESVIRKGSPDSQIAVADSEVSTLLHASRESVGSGGNGDVQEEIMADVHTLGNMGSLRTGNDSCREFAVDIQNSRMSPDLATAEVGFQPSNRKSMLQQRRGKTLCSISPAHPINRTEMIHPYGSVNEFLNGYGIVELANAFTYHRVDDMEIVLRLSEKQIESITDRVGLQVRLSDAIKREREIQSIAAWRIGAQAKFQNMENFQNL